MSKQNQKNDPITHEKGIDIDSCSCLPYDM